MSIGEEGLLGCQAPFKTAYGYNRIAYKQYDSTAHAKEHIKQRLKMETEDG